jgi:alpha-mannosidase
MMKLLELLTGAARRRLAGAMIVLLCLGLPGSALGQVAGPPVEGPPEEPPPPEGPPSFQPQPDDIQYLGRRVHLDTASLYDDHQYQTFNEWPLGIAHFRQRIRETVSLFDVDKNFEQAYVFPGLMLHEMLESYDPDLLARVKHWHEEGYMEFVGSGWTEFDAQLLSGESQVRQFLFAQRYLREHYGKPEEIAWLLHSPGLPPNMPQLLRLCGMTRAYFKTEHVPDNVFAWEGIDGSRVDSIMNPYPFTIETEEDNAKAKRTPKIKTTKGLFDAKLADPGTLPVHRGEFDAVAKGRLTTHGDVKRWHRDAENALISAEALSSLASLSGFSYPAIDLTQWWKDLMFHQQREILGGLCHHVSYENTQTMLENVSARAEWCARAALRHLAIRVPNPHRWEGAVVGNPLGWRRSGPVTLPVSPAMGREGRFRVTRGDGAPASYQVVSTLDGNRLVFWADDAPAFGYQTYRVEPLTPDARSVPHENPEGLDSAECSAEGTHVRIENGWVRVLLDKNTGQISSIFDKARGREVLQGGRPGNVFEAYMELPHEESALQLGVVNDVIPITSRVDTTLTDLGPLVARVRLMWRFQDSRIVQWISLTAGSPRIDFEMQLDWREYGNPEKPAPMVRVGFPVAAPGQGRALYSAPFAHVERPTNGDEVPALTWAAVVGADGGAALLNDCRHGHSVTPHGVLRLSLVRSSYEPDPRPDQYVHRIEYALLPLGADAQPAGLTREGLSFNRPLLAHGVRREDVPFWRPERDLPDRFEPLVFEGLPDVVPTCWKRAEDGDGYILRVYQAAAEPGRGVLNIGFPVTAVLDVNVLEDPIAETPLEQTEVGGRVPFELRPFQIRTLRIRPAP